MESHKPLVVKDLEEFLPPEYVNKVRQYIQEANDAVAEMVVFKENKLPKIPEPKAPVGGRDTKMVSIAKERFILENLSYGLTQPEIAQLMGVERNTINNRLNRMKKKYNCKTVNHLIGKALRTGFIR